MYKLELGIYFIKTIHKFSCLILRNNTKILIKSLDVIMCWALLYKTFI